MGSVYYSMTRSTLQMRYSATEYYDAFNPELAIEVTGSDDEWRVTATYYNAAGGEEDHMDEYAGDELDALNRAKTFAAEHGFDDIDLR